MRELANELHKFINEWEMRYSVCGVSPVTREGELVASSGGGGSLAQGHRTQEPGHRAQRLTTKQPATNQEFAENNKPRIFGTARIGRLIYVQASSGRNFWAGSARRNAN